MKKSTIRILLSLLLVVVIAVGGTLAYLMATDNPLRNTFALAEVETNVEEPESGTEGDKTPKVTNTGKSPVYVRARVVISGGDAGVVQDKITFTYSTHWVEGGDGFYYYDGILPANQGDASTTPPLFEGVKVDNEVPKEAEFSVDVYQESVLAPTDAQWSITDAQDAFKAKG